MIAELLEAAMVHAATHPTHQTAAPFVISSRLLHIAYTTDPATLQITGEVDLANHDLLAQAFHQAIATGLDDLHLDLSELDFIDVAGLTLCADAARRLSTQARRLVMLDPSPGTRKILHLIGLETTPGLYLPRSSR